MNKKSVNLLLIVGIVLVLSVSFVSAGWFSDFFAKITGKAQITGQTVAGTCSGSISAYCHTLDQGQSECDADPLCQYSDYDSWCQPKNANYCSTLTSQTTCQGQSGCSWATNTTPTCPVGYTCLYSNAPMVSGDGYVITLLSATDAVATIRVENNFNLTTETKEINEGAVAVIAGLSVYLKDVDETDGFFSATLQLNLPTTPTPACTDSDGVTETKEISELEQKNIAGLEIKLMNADETNLHFSAKIKVGLKEILLTESNPNAEFLNEDGVNYIISLISASDTTASIQANGELNYYVKGTAIFEDDEGEDNCIDSNTLNELYCTNKGGAGKSYTCPNGCFDGACIKNTTSGYYPSPFVHNGFADVAIVYGTQPGVSMLEVVAAENIQSNLQVYMSNSSLGNLLVKDSEVSQVSSKNWIVLGSICSDQPSNELLLHFAPDCERSREEYGIGPNQYIIETGEAAPGLWNSGKIILWVIGDKPQDVLSAVKYLATHSLPTTVGSKFVGNSTTVSGAEVCSVEEMAQTICTWNGRDYTVARETGCDLQVSIEGVTGHDTIDASNLANGNLLKILKDGVSLGVMNSCGDEKLLITLGGTSTLDQVVCDNGCILDGKCYPYNNRKTIDGGTPAGEGMVFTGGGYYCDVSGKWLLQVENTGTCDNHFECGSNICISNQCVEGSLIQKILAWFRDLFG